MTISLLPYVKKTIHELRSLIRILLALINYSQGLTWCIENEVAYSCSIVTE